MDRYKIVVFRSFTKYLLTTNLVFTMLGNLWDNIFTFRQTIPALASSENNKHHKLWNSIFKSDKWLQEITRLQGNPLIFGTMLDKVGEKKTYMTIHCGDKIKDPDFRWELFLECLHRPYKYNPHTREIKFRWGITLNVSEIESPEDPIMLSDKELLRLLNFKNTAQPTSQFSFYDSKQIFTLQQCHIIGLGEPPYYSKALKYGYAVNFQHRNKTTQVVFENKHKRDLLDVDCDQYGKVLSITLRR
jgi:hypothetical protein